MRKQERRIGDDLIDNRTEIINNVLTAMQPDLNDNQINRLHDVLYLQLDNWEIQERCTDLICPNNSFESFLKKFLATKKLEGKSQETLRIYNLYIHNMLASLNTPVDKITTFDLRFYLASYQEQHHVTNRSLSNMRDCICSFFSWLYKEGMISYNPTAAIRPIKYKKQSPEPFSSTEMELLRQACSTKRDRALIEFLYATGCRISEALALDRNDIDFNQQCAMVVGKGDKQRMVYLSDSSLLYLSDYLQSRTDCYPCLFHSFRQSNNNHRLTVSGAEYAIRKIGNRAGVKDTHPHRFRRTLATDMISRGAAIQDVSAILGHESINTTQIYCKISEEDIKYTYHRCIA